MNGIPGGEIILYQTEPGRPAMEVRLAGETVWLSLGQLVELFERDKSVISRHLRNIFRAGELDERSVVAKYATTAADGKTYQVDYYNLDAIISVGYRVNSKRGVQFRIWATQVLRQHLIQGYTLNERRLREQSQRLADLQGAIRLVERLLDVQEVAATEATGLLRVITDYSRGLNLLDQYDYGRLAIGETTLPEQPFVITSEMALQAVEGLRGRMADPSALFGQVRAGALEGALAAIYQAFGGHDLYPSVEEKAAHLLYFLVKDHPFVDGNKRIAAFLFLWFLDACGILYTADGRKRLADNALVALTLLVAESQPAEKDVMVKVIVNLINRAN
jgi:prophage maintenance system killer protein